MDNFAEKQRAENEEFRWNMEQTIASSLGESLILNL